jgi:chloride channel 3/4/5
MTDTTSSPRVILVEDHGSLVGLVTVKDVLRFTALEKPDEPSWHDRGGLSGMLEEALTWAANVMHNLVAWSRNLIRR